MNIKQIYIFPLAVAVGTAAATTVRAQVQPIVRMNQNPSSVANNPLPGKARAMTNAGTRPNTTQIQAQTASSVASVLPGFNPGSDGPKSLANSGSTRANTASPRAFGSFGIPYTETRVEAGGSSYDSRIGGVYLSTTVPYARIGKLTFTDGSGGHHYCTATLIRRSVIVTAAHCIQPFGSGNNFYQGWVFTPAYYNGAAPYGSFGWKAFAVSPTWSNGTDTGSGTAVNNDIAVIVIRKNASNHFLGDLVGWFNYAWNNYSFTASPKTANLSVAATTTFSYSSVLDGGEIMQRTDGPTYLTTIGSASQMWQGSNVTAGSSGGPWVVNFRSVSPVLSGGAAKGTDPMRAVIGVTSWGSADPNADKDNYASRFGQNKEFPNAAYGSYGAGNIGALLQSVCNQQVSPGVTLAAKGFC